MNVLWKWSQAAGPTPVHSNFEPGNQGLRCWNKWLGTVLLSRLTQSCRNCQVEGLGAVSVVMIPEKSHHAIWNLEHRLYAKTASLGDLWRRKLVVVLGRLKAQSKKRKKEEPWMLRWSSWFEVLVSPFRWTLDWRAQWESWASSSVSTWAQERIPTTLELPIRIILLLSFCFQWLPTIASESYSSPILGWTNNGVLYNRLSLYSTILNTPIYPG